jgi:hypothetical protein
VVIINSDSNEILYNTPNKFLIIGMGSLGIVFGTIGMLYLFFNINGFIIFTALELIIFSFIIHREFIHKPKTVEISQNCLILHYRLHKPLVINFNDIVELSILISKKITNTDQYDGEGTIKTNKILPYIVSSDIGFKIRDRYRLTTGQYPTGKIVYR